MNTFVHTITYRFTTLQLLPVVFLVVSASSNILLLTMWLVWCEKIISIAVLLNKPISIRPINYLIQTAKVFSEMTVFSSNLFSKCWISQLYDEWKCSGCWCCEQEGFSSSQYCNKSGVSSDRRLWLTFWHINISQYHVLENTISCWEEQLIHYWE